MVDDEETEYELNFIINRKDVAKSTHIVKPFSNTTELDAEIKRLIELAEKGRNTVEKPISGEERSLEAWASYIMRDSPAIGYAYEVTEVRRKLIKDEYVEFK